VSLAVVRKLLEERLASLAPSLPTAYENVKFDRSQNVPFQEVVLMPAGVEDPTFGTPGGPGLRREIGLVQIKLFYPEAAGSGAATARAEAVRSHYPRGLTLTQANVRVMIVKSPAIGPGRPDGGFWALPVSVYYSADVT
jgi:hypothetical protein